MFVVENFDGYANHPTLRFDGSASIFGNLSAKQRQLHYRTFYKDGPTTSILAYNLSDLVSFFALCENDKHGYGGRGFDILLNCEPTTIVGPWSSREGCFNTEDGSIAIVSCAVDHCLYHFKLSYILELIKRTKSNVGFFKTAQFDDNEIYYVPCVDEHNRWTRTLVKLTNSHSVNRIYHYIAPNGDIRKVPNAIVH